MFNHLQKPFMPGMVIPSNRDPNGWHFTFRDALGETYHYRISDWQSATIAKTKMREFVAYENLKI